MCSFISECYGYLVNRNCIGFVVLGFIVLHKKPKGVTVDTVSCLLSDTHALLTDTFACAFTVVMENRLKERLACTTCGRM